MHKHNSFLCSLRATWLQTTYALESPITRAVASQLISQLRKTMFLQFSHMICFLFCLILCWTVQKFSFISLSCELAWDQKACVLQLLSFFAAALADSKGCVKPSGAFGAKKKKWGNSLGKKKKKRLFLYSKGLDFSSPVISPSYTFFSMKTDQLGPAAGF